MANSTEVAGLQIAVDATDTVTATKALDNFTASAVRADAATSRFTGTASTMAAQTRQMSGAYRQASDAAKEAADGLNPLTQKLKEQVDTFGKSPVEIAKYRAAQANLSQGEQQLVASLAKKLAALRDGESAAKAAAAAEDALAKSAAGSAEKTLVAGEAARLSSTQMRELLTITRELGRGNFTRIPGSLSILAQQGNLSALALRALTSPVVLLGGSAAITTAAIVALTVSAERMGEVVKGIQSTLEVTGKSSLLTATQIRQAVDQVNSIHGVNQVDAEASVGSLARAPVTNDAEFQRATAILGDYAAALGVKVPEAAKELAKALETPTEGVKRLAAAGVLLSADQQLTIQRLEQTGQRAQAAAAFLKILEDNFSGARERGLTPFQKSLEDVGNAFRGADKTFSESHGIQTVLTGVTGLIEGFAKLVGLLKTASDLIAKITPAGTSVLSGALTTGISALPGGAILAAGINAAGAATPEKAAAPAESGAVASRNQAAQAAKALEDEKTAQQKQNISLLLQETAGYHSQQFEINKLIDERKQLQALLALPQSNPNSVSPANRPAIQDRIQGINEQLTKKDDHGFREKQLQLQEAINKATEDLQSITSNVNVVENKNVEALATWLAYAKDANKIGAARVAQLLQEAETADQITKQAAIAKEAKTDKGAIEGVNSEVSKLQGNSAESELDAFHKKYDQALAEMQARAQAFGDQGLKNLADQFKVATDKLQQLAQISDQAADIQKKVDTSEKTNQIGTKTNATLASAGYISNSQAQQNDVAANLALADSLSKQIPLLQQQADAMTAAGGDASKLQENIAALKLEVLQLSTNTDQLTLSLKNAFEKGLTDSLTGLLEHTKTLRQAFADLQKSIADAFISTVVKNFSNDLTTDLFRPGQGIFGGGPGNASAIGAPPAIGGFAGAFPSLAQYLGITPPIASTGAAALGVTQDSITNALPVNLPDGGIDQSIAALTGGGGAGATAGLTTTFTSGAATLSASLDTAFTTGATTLSTAITTALQSGGAGGGLGAFGSAGDEDFGADAGEWATGGYTGAGSKYQPAGIVHAGEFVHRQEVVKQPGAMAFLSHFNDVGMRAVASWKGYAAGGFAVPGHYPVNTGAKGGAAAPVSVSAIMDFDALRTAGYATGGFVLPGVHPVVPGRAMLANVTARDGSFSPMAPLGGYVGAGYAAGGLVIPRGTGGGMPIAVPAAPMRGYAAGGLVRVAAPSGTNTGLDIQSPVVSVVPPGVTQYKPGVSVVQNFHVGTGPSGAISKASLKQVGAEAFRGMSRAHKANN